MARNHYNYKIFNAAALVAGATSAAKVFSAGKDLIVAAIFGTGVFVDAFLLGSLLPLLCVSVIALPYGLALVPLVTQERVAGRFAAGLAVFEYNLKRHALLLLLLAIATMAFSRNLVALMVPDDAELRLLTAQSLRLLSPLILISGLSSLLISYLNTNEKFVLPALSLLCSPLAIIVALIVPHSGLEAIILPLGALAGNVLQLFALLWLYLRMRKETLKRGEVFNLANVKPVWSDWCPLVLSSLLMATTDIVDQVMASSLGIGQVASFNYGTRVVSALVGIVAGALTSAAFPYLSQMISRKEYTLLRQSLVTYTRLILIGASLLAIVLASFSDSIIRLLFERGAFTATDTAKVVLIQQFAALQLPFYILNALFIRVIMAFQLGYILSLITVVSIGLNIGLNVLFSHWYGVAGIALSTSCVYMWSAIALAIVIWRRQKRTEI